MVYTCRYESFIYSEERNSIVGSKNSRKEKRQEMESECQVYECRADFQCDRQAD